MYIYIAAQLKTWKLLDLQNHEWYLNYSAENKINNQHFGGTMVPANSIDDTLEALKAIVEVRATQ